MRAQPHFMSRTNDASQISECENSENSAQRDKRPSSRRMIHAFLGSSGPAHHGFIVLARPEPRAFPHGARSSDRVLAQGKLVGTVIAYDPFAPEGGHRVHIERDPAPSLRDG